MLLQNFSSGILASSITTSGTTVLVNAGNALPSSAGIFTAIIWNNTTYTDPSQDPNAEIVLGNYSSPNTYTITRAQENTSAASHSAGALMGIYLTAGTIGMTQVGNTSLVGVSSKILFSGLSPGRYKLVLSLVHSGTAGSLYLTFNGDSGANYAYEGIIGTGGTNYNTGDNSATYIALINVPSTPLAAGDVSSLDLLIQNTPTSTKTALCGTGVYSASGLIGTTHIGAVYSGASGLSSISINVTAGTMSGNAYLYQLQ